MPPQPMEPCCRAQVASGPPKTIAVGIRRSRPPQPDIRAAELAAMATGRTNRSAEGESLSAFSLTGILARLPAMSQSRLTQNKLKRVFEGRGITLPSTGVPMDIPITGRSPIKSGSKTRAWQTLLVNYQNTVLQAAAAGREWSDELPARREQVDFLRKASLARMPRSASALLQYTLGTRDFTTVLMPTELLHGQTTWRWLRQCLDGFWPALQALGGGWHYARDNEFVPLQGRRDEKPH